MQAHNRQRESERDRASPNQNTRAAHDIPSIKSQLAGDVSPRGVAARRAHGVEPGEQQRRNLRAPPLEKEVDKERASEREKRTHVARCFYESLSDKRDAVSRRAAECSA